MCNNALTWLLTFDLRRLDRKFAPGFSLVLNNKLACLDNNVMVVSLMTICLALRACALFANLALSLFGIAPVKERQWVLPSQDQRAVCK